MARPQKHQGEAFRGWLVRLDTTHGQPRARHRGELTGLGMRRSWERGREGMVQRTGRCVSPSFRDEVRAKSRLECHTQRPIRGK